MKTQTTLTPFTRILIVVAILASIYYLAFVQFDLRSKLSGSKPSSDSTSIQSDSSVVTDVAVTPVQANVSQNDGTVTSTNPVSNQAATQKQVVSPSNVKAVKTKSTTNITSKPTTKSASKPTPKKKEQGVENLELSNF